MTRPRPAPGEKPLYWVGSSHADLLRFPEAVADKIGYALSVAQFGEKHPHAKPWKGAGPGVFEIRTEDPSGTFRVVYLTALKRAVYVLHVFQKKSPRGIQTARTDIARVRQRLREARKDHEVRYGKAAE